MSLRIFMVDLFFDEPKPTGGCRSLHRERARSVVTLARNLHFLGSRFLTGLTAVFVARFHQAPAWKMAALHPLICRHHGLL
jgi:hypothetical protein